eukprot:235265_1
MGSTCDGVSTSHECINKDVSDQTGGSYSADCLWCIGYQNETGIDKCVPQSKYCDDKSLCQDYKVGNLDCDAADFYLPIVVICFTVAFGCAILRNAAEFPTLTCLNAFCILQWFPFMGLAIWCAVDLSSEGCEIWSWWLFCLFVGPFGMIILLTLLPIAEILLKSVTMFAMRPVGKWGLALLVLIIVGAMIFGFAMVLLEIIISFDWIGIFTKMSIIFLGYDWAALALEYQTADSCSLLMKFWYIIQCINKENDINDNVNNHIDDEINTNEHEEIEEEEKYPFSKSDHNAIPTELAVNASSSKLDINTPLMDNKSDHQKEVELLIYQLFFFVCWESTFIALAVKYEDLEPCFMNAATAGPASISIAKQIYNSDTATCCKIFLILFTVLLIIFSGWSCSCNDDCYNFHIIVIIMVSIWAFISMCYHLIRIYDQL